ncbi:MAG: rod-binding protein [Ghiorsea sp.]
MRDLVESVIGQVLKQKPTMKSALPEASKAAEPLKSFKHVLVEKETEIKDEKLWGAAKEFEAMFLQQMFTAMRRTIPESKEHPKSYADNMYDSMMDQAVAKAGSQRAPLGLAMTIYKQLERDGMDAAAIQEVQQAADTSKGQVGQDISSSFKSK